MTTSADEIVARFQERRTEKGQYHDRLRQINEQYNNKTKVALPELDEMESPAAVNLMKPGLDQLAMRIASVMPDSYFPPLRPGIDSSESRARDRRLATLGWWDMNGMSMLNRKRARHLLGYGIEVVTLSAVANNPLDKRNIPHWRLESPLESFPAPGCEQGDFEPSDCIFISRRSYGYLASRYPGQMGLLSKPNPVNPDTLFELLEYNDALETVLIVLGVKQAEPAFAMMQAPASGGKSPYQELERTPNRAEIPLAVVGGAVNLDKVQGTFDSILGMYQRAAKLDALETIAIFRSVFPEQWVMSHPQAPGTAEIVEQADGKRGVIGEVRGGVIQQMTLQPSLQATTAQDRLERAQRVMAGLPAEFGGESGSNIRTARRGELVMGAAVDMPVQEHQEVIAACIEAENRRAVAISKAYWGSKATSFHLPMNGKPGPYPDFTPNDIFESDYNVVKYSMPGTDANGLVIAMGQRVSLGELSVQTMMEMDPVVEDPVRELSQVQSEGLRRALLQSLEQQAGQGQLDAPTLARIISMKTSKPEMHLEDCVIAVHETMQAQQAQTAQQPPMPGAPEQQPGMAGQPVPPPQPSSQNLQQILQSLHGGAGAPGEMALAGAPPQGASQNGAGP